MKIKLRTITAIITVIMLLQIVVSAEPAAGTPPTIKQGQEIHNVTVSPNYQDAMNPDRTYYVNVSEWFDNTEYAKYHYSIDEKVGGVKLDENTGDFSYRPWVIRIGQTLQFCIYAENEFGKSADVQLLIYVDKMIGAPDAEFTMQCDTFYRDDNNVINENGYNSELKIGGKLIAHENRILKRVFDGKEHVYEKTYPLETQTDYRLSALFCNTLEEGEHTVKLVFTGGKDIDFTFRVYDVTKYSVTYVLYNPDIGLPNGIIAPFQEEIKKGDTIDLPIPADTKKYKFDGWWSCDENGEPVAEYILNTPIVCNTILKQKYVEKTYATTFYSDNNVYNIVETKYEGKLILPVNPSKSGYSFKGWYSEENGSGTKLEEDAVVTDNNSYYAYWVKKKSGSFSVSNTISKPTVNVKFGKILRGTKIEAKTSTRNAIIYYTLDETNPSEKSLQYTKPIKINEDITIKFIAIYGAKKSLVETVSYTVLKPKVTIKKMPENQVT